MQKGLSAIYSTVLLLVTGLLLQSCKAVKYAAKVQEMHYISIEAADTQSVAYQMAEQLIAPLRKQLNANLSQVIAISPQPLTKEMPASSLTNAFADWLLFWSKTQPGFEADMALFNFGGLRTALPQGPITRNDIFELMPFENEAVVVSMFGRDLQELLKVHLVKPGAPMAGARLTANFITQTIDEVSIGGKALELDKLYKIITSDYLLYGGDGFDFSLAEKIDYTRTTLRQAIFDWFSQAPMQPYEINVITDERIRVIR